MAASIPARVVVVDTSVVINLVHVNRLDILGRLDGWEFVVPEQIVEEVSEPSQAAMLMDALIAGHLRKEPSTKTAELEIYAELRQVMGRGEAACLAMAQSRHWVVASDERGRFLREGKSRLGEARIINTPGILLLAIRRGVLTIPEADRLKAILECHRFKMRFISFSDVIDRQ